MAAGIGIAAGLLTPGLRLPFPAAAGPTLAVVTFVLSCFALRCLSVPGTVTFMLLVAISPPLAFALGWSTHAPFFEAFSGSLVSFVSQWPLLVMFIVVPVVAGAILHGVLATVSDVREPSRTI